MNKDERDYSRRYKDEYNWRMMLFQKAFIYFFLLPVCKIYYGIKVEGRENLPKNRNIIYAGNHQCIIDPPFVSCAVRRPIAYMAKKELFAPEEKFQFLVKNLGAFAVDRQKPQMATFKTVKDIFKTSWGLGIFPEGGIREHQTLDKIQRGMAVIAKQAKADVVPIAICNWQGYPSVKTPFQKHVKVVIGKPISWKLSEDEITAKWCEHIEKYAGYKNEFTPAKKEIVTKC